MTEEAANQAAYNFLNHCCGKWPNIEIRGCNSLGVIEPVINRMLSLIVWWERF